MELKIREKVSWKVKKKVEWESERKIESMCYNKQNKNVNTCFLFLSMYLEESDGIRPGYTSQMAKPRRAEDTVVLKR